MPVMGDGQPGSRHSSDGARTLCGRLEWMELTSGADRYACGCMGYNPTTMHASASIAGVLSAYASLTKFQLMNKRNSFDSICQLPVHNSIIKRFGDNQPSIDNFTMRFVWLWMMKDANTVYSMNEACLKLARRIFSWKNSINTLVVLERSLIFRIRKVYLTFPRPCPSPGKNFG